MLPSHSRAFTSTSRTVMDPWEELDVDDSDLSASFSLRPCTRTATASHSLTSRPDPKPSAAPPGLIPGPAGAVQAAMHLRAQSHHHHTYDEEPIPTQEFIRRVVESGVDNKDDDFAANSWLCALDFLEKQGGNFGTPLSSIRKGLNTHRVAQVVAIIKSCTPNGLGDLMLTLKDPTGKIGASIHHKVLSEGEFGKSIAVGAVLVLQKVAVFFPSRSACYLNITVNNIVKVISKDSGSIVTKEFSTSSVNNTASNREISEKSWMQQEKFLPSQERNERIMNSLRQNSKVRGSEHNIEKHMETGHAAPEKSCLGHELYGSQNGNIEKEPSLVEKTVPDGITEMTVGEDPNDNDQVTVVTKKPNLGRVTEGDNPLSITPPISASAKSVENPDDDQETGRVIGAKRQRQPLISRTSLPEYTEEQLDLFEFD